jgi:hypothetical protein
MPATTNSTNSTHSPASPASLEQPMIKQFATQISHSANACSTAPAVDTQATPVSAALARAREEISECHYHIDLLINGLAPALRLPPPCEEQSGRLEAASPLANEIELIADNIRNMRLKITDARERLTL